MKPVLAFIAAATLSACGSIDFENTPDGGRFEGSLLVMWVEENNTNSGDGRFVFLPSPGDPLRFIRDTSGNPDATVAEIEPGMMYTDGGSIPRALQPFRGFSPWGYAPAYMVHDWLFVARRCLTDNMAEGREPEIADMPSRESAEIMAETIRALIRTNLVAGNDVAPRAISSAVAGLISRQRWTARGECENDRVSADHRAQIERAFPGATPRSADGFEQMLDALRTDPGGPVARIVDTLTF